MARPVLNGSVAKPSPTVISGPGVMWQSLPVWLGRQTQQSPQLLLRHVLLIHTQMRIFTVKPSSCSVAAGFPPSGRAVG